MTNWNLIIADIKSEVDNNRILRRIDEEFKEIEYRLFRLRILKTAVEDRAAKLRIKQNVKRNNL